MTYLNDRISNDNGGKLGVLGDGQLAMMLVEAARSLGHQTVVLSPSGNGPATVLATQIVTGDIYNESAVSELVDAASVIAIDQELPRGTLPRSLAATSKLVPHVDALRQLSDKTQQKRVLSEHGIATSPWICLAETSDHGEESATVANWLQAVAERFPKFVLKTSTGGYDGRGTFIVRDAMDGLSAQRAKKFVMDATKGGVGMFAERFVPFAAEVAVVGVRGRDGVATTYPTVATFQDQGICVEVRGGSSSKYVPAHAAGAAEDLALRIADIFGIVGSFAVEFFLTSDGALLVNEIAPRVHNSGHYTINAAKTSQFENHWRALLGLALGATAVEEHFAMINILGADGYSGRLDAPDFSAEGDHIFCHWYGKLESRPRRKLGHLTVVADTAQELDRIVVAAKHQLQNWTKSLVDRGGHR